jgi:sorting nexin-4
MEASFTPISWDTSSTMGPISVCDPQKHGDGATPFITYSVVSAGTSVRRRFADFVALQVSLASTHPACIVAPLPDKRRVAYVIGDRFSEGTFIT